MCRTIVFTGGVADGVEVTMHRSLPDQFIAWHDDSEDNGYIGCSPSCTGTKITDLTDPDDPLPPDGVLVTVYRRRWNHVQRLTIAQTVSQALAGVGSVVPVPYDMVSDSAELPADV